MNQEAAPTVTPSELRTYATACGWQEDPELAAAGYPDVFVHEDLDATIDLAEPQEALRSLAYAEGRTDRELALDIVAQRTTRAHA